MSLFISSLNSGSNGNCYYVGNSTTAVLVDVGINCKEVEKRMQRLGLNISHVKAIFISHEHTDHVKGVEVLSKKYKLPVYITNATLNNSKLNLPPNLIYNFTHGAVIQIDELKIKAFSKIHDAADPYSFVVSGNNVNIGVFTDIGACCQNVKEHFKSCHAVFLEANYDAEMLRTGMYPYFLKARISGGVGHLSNDEALNLLIEYRSPQLSHLILSHLSRENNSPEIVKKLFTKFAGGTQIEVASRYYETDVFEISSGQTAPVSSIPRGAIYLKGSQLALFN